MMYELDGKKLSVQSKTKSGATPSDILYSSVSKSLWVTQRFNNELWEIDPATRKVKTKIAMVVNRWLWLRLQETLAC